MKIRTDYVTNSSSSSFIISKKDLTPLQIYQMRNFKKVAEDLKLDSYNEVDGWYVSERNDFFLGSTIMDNFMFEDFFKAIGVDLSKVNFDY